MRRSIQIILACLLTASLLGLAWFAGSRKQEPQLGQVVITAASLGMGTLISPEDLTLLDLPAGQIQPGWLTDPAAAVGLTGLVDLAAGEILHEDRLGQSQAGLSYNTAPGRRLMTIQPDAASANGYWLADGSLVDVYLVPRSGGDQEVQVLRELRILQVLDGRISDAQHLSDPPMLCLDLSKEQALLLAQAEGRYYLKVAVVSQ